MLSQLLMLSLRVAVRSDRIMYISILKAAENWENDMLKKCYH